MLDELSCGILLIDTDLRLLWCSSAAQELLQTTSLRITGLCISHLITLPAVADTATDESPGTLTVAPILQPQQKTLPQQPHKLSLHDMAAGLSPHNPQRLYFDCLLHNSRGGSQAVHATLSRVLHPHHLHPDHTQAAYRIEFLPLESHIASWQDARERQDSRQDRNWLLNLAHELKNPLGGILGAAQLVRDEIPLRLREYIDVIHAEALRMSKLLDNMLLPHRIQGDRKPCNIHEICEHVCTLLSSQYPDISIRRDYDISLPDVPLSRSQWVQILLNLMQNAAQELSENPEPGRTDCIQLRTRIAHRQSFNRQLHRQCLQISIQDNGRGIPPELQHAIFRPLVTGRDRGTGLGLSLVQSLVHAHGGAVRCQSSPAEGTRFTLLLPLLPLSGSEPAPPQKNSHCID